MSKEIVHLEVRLKTICHDCEGRGYIVVHQNPQGYEYICQTCMGSGSVFNKKIIDLETLKEMMDESKN